LRVGGWGFRVQDLGSGLRVEGLRFGVKGKELTVKGLGFGICGPRQGFRVRSLGYRVQDWGFQDEG
jgi:hypothetical protein